jgi:hypothetical protein
LIGHFGHIRAAATRGDKDNDHDQGECRAAPANANQEPVCFASLRLSGWAAKCGRLKRIAAGQRISRGRRRGFGGERVGCHQGVDAEEIDFGRLGGRNLERAAAGGTLGGSTAHRFGRAE